MKIKIAKKDIIWNYLGILCSMSSYIIWIPVIIYFLPTDLIGVWYIFISIGMIVNLFDFGFSPQIARTVAYAWSGAKELKKTGIVHATTNALPNYQLLYTIIKTCTKLYRWVSTIAFFLMISLGSIYIYYVVGNLIRWDTYIAWILYSLSIFYNIYIGYYIVFLRGIGDIVEVNKANIISKIAMIFIGLIGLSLGFNILSLSIANLFCGVIQRKLCRYYLYKKHNLEKEKMFSPINNNYSINYVFKMMWHNAWRDGLVTIASYFNNQATVLICGAFLTLSETGIYSISVQIIMGISSVASGLSSSYYPALQSAFATKDKEAFKKMVAKSTVVFDVISVLCVALTISIGLPILSFLKQDVYVPIPIFVMLSLHLLLIERHKLSAAFISTMNHIPYAFSFICFGIISVFSSFIVLSIWPNQLMYMIGAEFFVQCAFNNWYWIYFLNNRLCSNEYKILKLGCKELLKKEGY